MKATHIYKRNGHPCAHLRIQFSIDGHKIARELWWQVEHGYVKPALMAAHWTPEKVVRLVRDRMEAYGIYAYQHGDFEGWFNLSTLEKHQHYAQAKVWFPDFFNEDLNDFIENE